MSQVLSFNRLMAPGFHHEAPEPVSDDEGRRCSMAGSLRTEITTEFPEQTIQPFIDEADRIVVGVTRDARMSLYPTNVQIIPGAEDDEAVRILTGGGAMAFTDPDTTVEPFFEEHGILFIRITTKDATKEIKTPVDVSQFSGQDVNVSLEYRKGDTSRWSQLTEDEDTPEDE
jgi:hypothetical protein